MSIQPTPNSLSWDATPPIWFVNVNLKRVEINDVDHLYNFNIFRKKIAEQLKIWIPRMKAQDWDDIVAILFQNINVNEVPEDASKVGEFKDYLQEFCQDRGESFSMDELGMGKVFTEDAKTYFRLGDLCKYLESTKKL